ncbi:MAG: BACON domain-containing carbohydrate-binding protein [Rikenellaceae bacterium]
MALLTSCSKDSTETPSGSYDLSINVSSLPFYASSDLSQQIVLTAGNQWSLLNDSDDATYAYADWVSDVSPKFGGSGDNTVTITVDDNGSLTSRYTTLYFGIEMDDGNYKLAELKIEQSSSSLNNAEITLSCPSIEYANNAIALSVICESNSALTYNVTVDADLPWEITEAAASWVKTSVSGDRITVTIKNNGFNSGRETAIYLRQKYDDVYYGKEQAIVISQAAKTTAILDTYRDLGYGYDISGLYAHKDYIKKQVLDWDKLNSYDIIDDVTYYGTSVNYVTSTYTTMSEAQDSLCLTAGVNIKYNGFTTEVNGSYKSSYLSYEESEFGKTKATVNLAKLSTSYNVNSESDLSNLRSCLKDDVYAAINSLEKIEDAKTFIETYGAYVMMGCTYGGTYKYTISAIRNKTSSSYDWSTAVSAGYEDATGLNTGLVNAGVSETFSMANETYTYETEATINGGGGSLKDANAWLASLTTDVTTASVYMSLIDFGGVNMIAISELAEDKSVRDLLAQAIEELTQNNAVETVTASQSVFSYEFWIGEIFYYSDDAGSTAEVKFDIDAKIIDSSSNSWTSMKGNWTDMWSSNDLGDDTYISVPNNGEYATVLEMGIGTTTATNKFSTGSIFTGGAGSYVIGFKIYAVEDDSSSGDDDASTTYAYFQTKTGYLGSRIDEKPFYYVYSVDDMAYPQEVIQGYVDKHTLSWTSVAESLGNGDLRNGYAIVEGVNSISEHKWRFTIYYRML